MLTEDDNPTRAGARNKTGSAVHQNRGLLSPEGALDDMSVAELQDYVAALTAEIARVEAEITKKSASRAAAEALFGR